MARVACIGECMVELRQAQGGGGLYARAFGGDTLNTAIYLARLDVNVDYLTALGDDALSDEMVAAWTAEGVGTRRVLRLPGKLPGLYMIQTDARGERQFFDWRETSAARRLMDVAETDEILNSLMSYDIIYLSAITLSIYDEAGRQRLLAAVKRARLLGTRFVFDTNFRARGWPDLAVARQAFGAAFEVADIVLTSTEDLLALYPGEGHAELKSMRTHPDHLRRGVAVALLDHLIGEAKERAVTRLSLETGSGPAFDPALALYRKRGFANGEAFGDYAPSAFNQFLHLKL